MAHLSVEEIIDRDPQLRLRLKLQGVDKRNLSVEDLEKMVKLLHGNTVA